MLGSYISDSGTVIGDYSIGCRIGEGAYGSVFVATHIRTHERYAIKVMLLENIKNHGLEASVRREAQVLQSLRHVHVVSLIKAYQSPNAMYFVMELAEGGELFDNIIQSKHFSENVARKYFQQLVSAIHFCHSKRVAHRDLKAENLLLDSKGRLKVCDFGLCVKRLNVEDEAQESPLEKKHQPVELGTLSYMCPEMLQHDAGDYDPFVADLWSAGVILYFMVTGCLPFDGNSDEETMFNIVHHKLDYSLIQSPQLRSFVEALLAEDPVERLTLEQILKEDWFLTDLDRALFPENAPVKKQFSRSNSRSFLDFSQTSHQAVNDITEEENNVITKAFQSIDVDGYGWITRDELRDTLIQLRNGKVDATDVEQLVRLLSPNGGDTITFEQFRDAWIQRDLAHTQFKDANTFQLQALASLGHATAEKDIVRQLREGFNVIDASHTGLIGREELKSVFTGAGIETSEEDLNNLVSSFFVANGKKETISFEDFIAAITSRNLLVRHPLGRKLACAAHLEHFCADRQLEGFLTSGFTASGSQVDVLRKICTADPRCLMKLEGTSGIPVPFAWGKDLRSSEGSEPDVANATVVFDVIILAASCDGYCVVKVKRISGSTADFHEAAQCVYRALESEREQALIDSRPIGESELL